MYVVLKDLDMLTQQINLELFQVYYWVCANKLTLNLSKNKYIIFQPRKKLPTGKVLPPLCLAGHYLGYSFNVKYQGLIIIIDCHLSWHDHIE